MLCHLIQFSQICIAIVSHFTIEYTEAQKGQMAYEDHRGKQEYELVHVLSTLRIGILNGALTTAAHLALYLYFLPHNPNQSFKYHLHPSHTYFVSLTQISADSFIKLLHDIFSWTSLTWHFQNWVHDLPPYLHSQTQTPSISSSQ